MKVRTISSPFVIGLLVIASCSLEAEDESLSNDGLGELGEDGQIGSLAASLTKGRIGAVNGQADYCNDVANTCVAGEGDCDSNAQCGGGTVCTSNNGARFGFPATWDVCVPLHCTSKVKDGDETSTDCGGACGDCATCVGTPGAGSFCAGCLCDSGAGDCDANSECAAGLVCAANNGASFGLPTSYDVCVPAHCTNGVEDAASAETGVDEGGPCGTKSGCSGTPGTTGFCGGCKCASGEGDCDSDLECATGLICASNNGPKFGLPASFDICVPPHCRNGVQDGNETGIDVGGECEAAPTQPARNLFFSEYAEGTGNSHAVEIYNAGSTAQSCVVNVYFSGSPTAGASIALTSSINPQGLYVLCRTAGAITTPPCDQSSDQLLFTGDDAVELVCGGVTQDVVGQIGFDPGSQWGSGNASTADNTMRRKCGVSTGDIVGADVFTPSIEWDGFSNNDFTNLGIRTCP